MTVTNSKENAQPISVALKYSVKSKEKDEDDEEDNDNECKRKLVPNDSESDCLVTKKCSLLKSQKSSQESESETKSSLLSQRYRKKNFC